MLVHSPLQEWVLRTVGLRLRGVRLKVITAVLLLMVVAGLSASPTRVTAQSGRLSRIERELSRDRNAAERAQRREQVLSTEVAAATQRISELDGRLTELRGREAALTRRLEAARTELAATQRELRTERARLARLRARLAAGRRQLAARLVAIYKADSPDLLTVVLSSRGFADLLENAAFMRRISRQDRRVLTFVAEARDETKRREAALASLERRQAEAADAITEDHQALVAVRMQVERARRQSAAARSMQQRQLGAVRVSIDQLRGEVRALEAAQRRVSEKLLTAQQVGGGPAPVAGPPSSGGGTLIWPVEGPITSPFCEVREWEECHPGLDIAAPDGTPIRAAAAGTVSLLQSEAASGGYGNFTCLQHAGGLSTCYAHQSGFATSAGATVEQGEVIGYVGDTGFSFGPHLHFEVRANGAVANPLNYL